VSVRQTRSQHKRSNCFFPIFVKKGFGLTDNGTKQAEFFGMKFPKEKDQIIGGVTWDREVPKGKGPPPLKVWVFGKKSEPRYGVGFVL